jgi:uncharacterized protein
VTIKELSEDKLNMFIDGQLDTDEMDEIRKILLDDKDLREQVCQLKAVRELVGYAYSDVPEPSGKASQPERPASSARRAFVASALLIVGVIVGWSTYEYSPNAAQAVSADNAFQYVANHVQVEHGKRKVILHIDSSDLQVVNAALNEADELLATYHRTKTPFELDIVTNKTGINILRPGISPYIDRIRALIDDDDVAIYACNRSIAKALKKEGAEIVLMPGVTTDKSARDLIPERLKEGWVYIKA